MAFGNTKAAFDLFSESVKNGNGRIKSLKDTISAATVGMNWWAVGIGAAITAISLIAKAVEEYKQKLREAAQEASKQAEESSNAVKSLLELKTQLNEGTKSSDELTLAFKEQLKAMGWTETKIDSLIKKYGNLAGAMDEATREALEDAKRDAYADVSTSGQTLIQEAKGNTHVGTYYSQNAELSTQIRKMLADSPAILDGGIYRMSKDASAADIYEYYNTLKDISQLIQETAAETGDESLLRLDSMSPTPYYQVTEALNALSESAKQYGDAINRLHSADAQLELSNFLKTNDIATQEDFDAYIKGIEDGTIGMVNGKEASDEYKQVLIDVANDAFPQFSNSAKDAGKNANEMTDSLDSLASAIKAAESAFELFNEVEKDFNSTGAISAENIQKILNKFPELEDELYEYIMGMRSGASVMDLLKIKSDDMATMSIKAFKQMYLSSNSVSKDIKDDYESAFKLIGLEWDNTQSVMANVNTQIVDANGQATQTFVEQWTEACKLAGANVSTFAQGISALLGGDFYDGTSGVYRVQGKGIYYKDGSGMDGKGTNLVNVKAMELIDSGQFANTEKGRSDAYKAAYNILSNQMDKSWENQAEFERRQKEFEERMKQYAVTSDDKSSGSDKNEALDNYLKNAENLYKVHQDELKYINDLQWAYDNLTNNDKERLDIESKISEAQRDYADNRIKDIEHENKLLLSQGKTEYDLIDNYRKVQRIAHEEAGRLRKLGYNEESNEIQELQNQWLEYQSKISEADFTHSENYIEDRNFYDDWEKYGDSEIKAWKRVLDRFKAEYPNEIDKIKEIEKNYFEAKKNQREEYIDDLKAAIDKEREAYEDLIDKQKESLDLEKQRLSSNATLLQSYYNVINSIADEQANIKKELRANLKLYEYTDEATRKLLFNEENYVELSSELNSILGKANRLQSEYKNAIANATLENIEEITNNYERQYELLLKQYEIKKAELEVEKKRQQLNNVLAEKNVQMVIGGKLTWVANTQDVINAQEELADAEAAAAQAIRDKTQTLALQEIQANEDRLTTIQNNLDKQLEEMNEKWDTLVESFEEPVKDIETVLAEMAESDVPGLQNIINNVASALSSLVGKTAIGNGAKGGGGGIGSIADALKSQDYMAGIQLHLANGDIESALKANELRNQKIDTLGMSESKLTSSDIKKMAKSGYASGTLNATKGWHEVEEEGNEILITKDGKIRNFSGGETVLTADQTDTFMKIINGDFEFPMPYCVPNNLFGGFTPIIPEFKTREIVKSEDHSVNFYGGVTVQDCTDVNDFVRQLTNGIKRN